MVNDSLEEIRDMVSDLRDRCNVILVVIEATLGVADAGDFAPPEGVFEVDETAWAVTPEQAVPNIVPEPEDAYPGNTRDLPVDYCPRTDQHDPHEWAYVTELGKGDAKFCPGIPF